MHSEQKQELVCKGGGGSSDEEERAIYSMFMKRERTSISVDVISNSDLITLQFCDLGHTV